MRRPPSVQLFSQMVGMAAFASVVLPRREDGAGNLQSKSTENRLSIVFSWTNSHAVGLLLAL
jgi:hypothetical protein